MKKLDKTKNLVLSTQTVRALQDAQLHDAGGGGNNSNPVCSGPVSRCARVCPM